MTDPTILSTFTTALADFGPQLLQVAGAALGVGILMLGLRRGWSLVKTFVK